MHLRLEKCGIWAWKSMNSEEKFYNFMDVVALLSFHNKSDSIWLNMQHSFSTVMHELLSLLYLPFMLDFWRE